MGHDLTLCGKQGRETQKHPQLQHVRISGSDKLKRGCRAGKVLNNQTHEDFSEGQSSDFYFIIPSVSLFYSILALFCFFHPDVFLLSILMSSVYLLSHVFLLKLPWCFPPRSFLEFSFSLLCFFPTAYIPEQNLSSIIKVTM